MFFEFIVGVLTDEGLASGSSVKAVYQGLEYCLLYIVSWEFQRIVLVYVILYGILAGRQLNTF